MSATISVSPTTMAQQQLATATIVVSNSGGAVVNVLSCQLTSNLTGTSTALDKTSFAPGVAPLSAGFPVAVPASGTLTIRVPVVYFQTSGSTTFNLSASIPCSDGSTVIPTAATLTITSIPGIPSTYAGPT